MYGIIKNTYHYFNTDAKMDDIDYISFIHVTDVQCAHDIDVYSYSTITYESDISLLGDTVYVMCGVGLCLERLNVFDATMVCSVSSTHLAEGIWNNLTTCIRNYTFIFVNKDIVCRSICIDR